MKEKDVNYVRERMGERKRERGREEGERRERMGGRERERERLTVLPLLPFPFALSLEM